MQSRNQSQRTGVSFLVKGRMSKRSLIAEINGTHLANKREHMVSNIPLCEASTGICKKVFPVSLERRCVLVNISKSQVVFYDEVLRQVRCQTPSPFSKSKRIDIITTFAQLGSVVVIACVALPVWLSHVGMYVEASFESRTEHYGNLCSILFFRLCAIVAEYMLDITKKEWRLDVHINWGRFHRTRKISQ